MAAKNPSLRLLLVEVMFLCFVFEKTSAAGAGRAFPIVAENYAITKFQRINPRLDWDPTNFLVDLSGLYANCRSVENRGFVSVDRQTQEGNSIAAYVDYTDGQFADVNSVNEYLTRVIDRWVDDGRLYNQIRNANRFGCSVRPGCPGSLVVVSCLFSPAYTSIVEPPPSEERNKPKALAFTPEQYAVAERITNNRWDRSHTLENLSGLETDCSMIAIEDWKFTQAYAYARNQRTPMRIFGTYGYALNRGSTQDALEVILRSAKRVSTAIGVGCSLIPDCVVDRQMYVVVSCIYQEA